MVSALLMLVRQHLFVVCAGTSVIMQVKPCDLPKLELAMADRVKACFGVAELDPGWS